jgi:hypothetical protein
VLEYCFITLVLPATLNIGSEKAEKKNPAQQADFARTTIKSKFRQPTLIALSL